MSNLNLLTVAAAALVHFVIGAIWYSPLMFGKQWQTLSGQAGFKPEIKDMVLTLGSSLITVYVLAVLVTCAGARSWLDGAVIGIMVEVGLIATLLFGDMVFLKTPFKIFLIRNGYNLLALAAAGAILAVR